MTRIDLNSDMGELDALAQDGTEDALLECVSSVNVACGAHAGGDAAMERTIRAALAHGVAIGAHPGYPDRANFGRLHVEMSAEELACSVHGQLLALDRVARACGATIVHVKPHGALYNEAARNPIIARIIAQGIGRWNRDVVVVGLAGSVMLDEFRGLGFRVAAEAFADRHYEPDGSLRSRQLEGALIRDPDEAARQALELASSGNAGTICLHSDAPGAVEIARAVARALRESGIAIQPLTGH